MELTFAFAAATSGSSPETASDIALLTASVVA